MKDTAFEILAFSGYISLPKVLVLRQLMIPAAAAKSLQACPTLCDPIDGSPPGSPVPGILQARTLEWLPLPSPRVALTYVQYHV